MQLDFLRDTAAKAANGIARSIPAIWYLPGWRRSWATKVVCTDPSLALPAPISGQMLDVELPVSAFLTKEITAPKAAQSQLNKIVDLAVQNSSPNGAKSVIWRHQITGKESKSLTVKIYLIKKALLERLKAEVTAAGSTIRTARIQGVTANAPLIDNRAQSDKPLRVWGIVAASVTTALVGLLIFGEVREARALQHQLGRLEDQKRQLAAQALSLRQAHEAAASAKSDIENEVSHLAHAHKRLPLLLDLTETFVDETWVSEISLQENRLRLSGFTTTEVSTLLAQLQELPWTSSVKLDGPISFDSLSRQHRFEFLIETQLPSGKTDAASDREATQ